MKLLSEPLVHFLALGALLFVLYSMIGDQEARQNEIVVTTGKVDQLVEVWTRTRQRPPTEQELQDLIDDFVIDEILYREAKALGLDEDDTIIRKRLRQKMEFIAEGISETTQPTEAELQKYLDENPATFRLGASVTFEHVFFNEDRRGDKALDDAVSARNLLIAGELADPGQLGDGIPIPGLIEDASTRQVSSMFGSDFATELLTLPVGEWAGPVPSRFGLHVVRISTYKPGGEPSLDEVRDAVSRVLSAERSKIAREQMYASFRERYMVTIETAPEAP